MKSNIPVIVSDMERSVHAHEYCRQAESMAGNRPGTQNFQTTLDENRSEQQHHIYSQVKLWRSLPKQLFLLALNLPSSPPASGQ